MSRALIAMSGGVDSAAAAVLTLDAGYDCVGVTMKLLSGGGSRCCSLEDINDARAAAGKLGIPHYVLNYTEAFTRHVIEPFIASYERGETPNPCVECNRRLKFGLLLRRARELEAEILVTGHYARIEKSAEGRFFLKKGLDARKDQSYFLYTMSQDELAALSFPLGSLSKAEAREIAGARGLPNAHKRESQDICFAGDGGYAAFMEAWRGKPYPEGDITDESGRVIGRHRGLPRYTLGQRKGLGVACGEARYVTAKNAAGNTLTLGKASSLYSSTLEAEGLNLIACESLPSPVRLAVKTRYLQKEAPSLVEQTGPGLIRVTFDTPQRAITPGQAAVLYDGEIVVGGGTIRGQSC